MNSIDIEHIPLFRELTRDERDHIKKRLKEESFKKGEPLFLEGNLCERIFIVKSGRVKIFRLSSSGKEQILEVLNPGDTCACNPGAEHWSCSSSAQATTDCSVWILSRFNYVQMIQNNSRMMRNINRIFADRLCRFSSLIEGVFLDDPHRRLIKFILDLSDHQDLRCSKENCLCLNMTQEEVAQRLGITRVTVARHLQQLKKSRHIDYHADQITILDKQGLGKALL